jgi:hypothetical protein
MGTLIETTELFKKASEILDIPVQHLTHHHSLLEVIDLLVKEIEAMEDYIADVHNELEQERSGKPDWMK